MSWEKYRKVPTKREVTKIDRDSNECFDTICYKKLDSARFMKITLPNIVYNLGEEIDKIKWKYCDIFLQY